MVIRRKTKMFPFTIFIKCIRFHKFTNKRSEETLLHRLSQILSGPFIKEVGPPPTFMTYLQVR